MREESPQEYGSRQVLEEASAWFVDFRAVEIDRAARQGFLRWLRRSPEHVRAYMEISGAYAQLPTPGSVPAETVAALIDRARVRESVVIPLRRRVDHSSGGSRAAARGRPTHGWRPITLRTAVLAAVGMVGMLCVWLSFPHPPTYETQTAQQRTITLEDGSQIVLNARSEVRVDFSPTRRSVELVEGEALFKVAKDPKRPFFVSSSGTVVRDVGTQFDVNHLESGTTVTVIEGRVTIQAESRMTIKGEAGAKSSETEQPFELSAGEQAIITPVSVDIPAQPNIRAATAWTQGELEFFETPLADVVIEFNRYSRRPLVLESAALAALRINGVYSSKDTDSLILFLRSQPYITVTESGSEIHISKR